MAEVAQSLTHTFARKLEDTQWGKAVFAAFIAAVCYLLLQMLTTALIQGYGAWLPVRMISAIALGTEVLAEGSVYVSVLVVALLLHFGLSIMTAWIVAPVIQGMPILKSVLVGAAAGLVIYLVNFHLLTLAFTWFASIRGWSTLVNHLIFGAVLAWTYQYQRQKG